MSRQSEAKEAQAYRERAETCALCKHVETTRALPAWMVVDNERSAAVGGSHVWNVDANGVETSAVCSVGKFKVKKLGVCALFIARDPK